MVPNDFQIQYSPEQIAEAVKKMGQDISIWANEVWKKSHTDIVTIPVLRGGIFFFADLVRNINTSVEIAPAQTWAYSPSENASMNDQVKIRVEDVPVTGRSVLLVDDICDSGRTLDVLSKKLKEMGANEIRSAVLIRRIMDHETFKPEYVGFNFSGPEWFVGYGMEDSGRWRNLPATYIIKQS